MIKCNQCSSKLESYNHKGTHILVCTECPNVQVDYYGLENAKHLAEFLIEGGADR